MVILKTTTQCPTCELTFESLGLHWQKEESHRVNIDLHKKCLLTGILMGDGSITRANGENPRLVVTSINREYLGWLYCELGWLSSSIRVKGTAEENAKMNRDSGFDPEAKAENYHDSYTLNTISHPDLEVFANWYSSGKKRFPSDLRLDSTILKQWFVCDGGLVWNGGDSRAFACITSANESDKPKYLQSLFSDIGIKTEWQDSSSYLRMPGEETEEFLRYLGDPIPGFEYKWESRDREKYTRLKEKSYNQEY